MIVVTRLNRTRFAVNPDLVERIQAAPDTTITMVDGARFVVTESMQEVIDQIIRYRARVLATAAAWPHADANADATTNANAHADATGTPSEGTGER